jgi:hypothetical protein
MKGEILGIDGKISLFVHVFGKFLGHFGFVLSMFHDYLAENRAGEAISQIFPAGPLHEP